MTLVMEEHNLTVKKQDDEYPSLNFVEKPEMAGSPTDFFCSLKDCIQAALPLAHQQPLVAESEWTVKYLINSVDAEVLQEALRKTTDLAFGRFLVAVGLFETDGGRDFAILLEDCQDLDECQGEDFDGLTDQQKLVKSLVDEINHAATFPFYRETVEKLSNFFLLSKEEIINDFVIPFYKVGKASHLWLEDLTDSAFNRGLKAKLGLSPQIYIDCVNGFDFTDGDHVSIFESFLEQQDEVLRKEEEFQAKGLKDGWSLHCLRQYPSGFPKGENCFPRAFIHRQDGEGRFTFDEMKHFIEGLPTELDRKVGMALLESRRDDEDFAEGIELSFIEGYGGRKITKGVLSCYNFDGVKALAEWLDCPNPNDPFGVEIHQIFRDFVSEANDDLLAILSEGNDWWSQTDDLLRKKFGTYPDWVGLDNYGFLLTLSERVKVPKKILKCYRKVANQCQNDFINGNY